MIQLAHPYVGEPATLPLALIDCAPQIRTRNGLDQASLTGLADSIKEHGVIQPIIVRRSDAERFEVVAGERRLLAASMAGLADIPVLIRDGTEGQLKAVQAVENLQRADLTLPEIAEGLHALSLHREFKSWGEVARSLGKSPAWISKHRAVLKYKPLTKAAMLDGLTEDTELLGVLNTIERTPGDKARATLIAALDSLSAGTLTRDLARFLLAELKAPVKSAAEQIEDLDQDDDADPEGVAPAGVKEYAKLELAEGPARKLLAALQFAQKNKPSSRPGDDLVAYVEAFIAKAWGQS